MDDEEEPRPQSSRASTSFPGSGPNTEPVSRKRRHTECSSSSDDDVEMEIGRDRDSSSWEDQESSDDTKLKIDVPKRKILRKRYSKSPTRKNKEIVIPEDVLAECSKLLVMDQSLDAKAKSINWGTKQVKMVLRAIVQSEEMMIMLRNAGLATGEKQPQQEPKMTRAMTKKVVEAGGEVPFILPPATPVKDVNKELFCLFDEELNEEDNDPEYNPEVDANSDDDDSMLTSEPSEVGTPCTQNTDSRLSMGGSAMSTPTSSHRPTPEQFKRPFRALCGDKHQASRTLDFDGEEGGGRVYSTRSRVNITDKAIEELEQLFVPPDITPDMYEIPDENENEEYVEFLKELYGGPEHVDDLDFEDDPEFVYCPDEADQEIKDPEELRNDKATKITKKEVADLMAELLDFANQNNDEDNNKKVVKRRKTPLPGDAIFDAVKEHSQTDSTAGRQSRLSAREGRLKAQEEREEEEEEEEEAVPVMTDAERQQLALQFQQHIQLLTQMSLMSSHNPRWSGVRQQTDRMMSDMFRQSVQCQNSVAAQPNLLTSMAVIREWDQEGQNPTVITKNKNSVKHRKRNRYFNISSKLMDFMSRQKVFYFPLLLPAMGLSEDEGRIIWTPAEDHLLAFAMRESVSLARKPGLKELSFAVQRRFMRSKSAKQIKDRIRNLKLREEENPVVKFINTGVCQPKCLQHTWSEVGTGCKTLVEMFVSSGTNHDFGENWVRQLKDLILRKRLRTTRLILPSGPVKASVGLSCGAELLACSPALTTPQPILCVDGGSATPSSDTDTAELNNQPGGQELARSPIKKLVLSVSNYQKSPLKAASDRIIKKYTIISPHKRTGSYLLKSPLKKVLRRKPVPISPKPVTPSRKLPCLSIKNSSPGIIDSSYSPKSPNQDEVEGLNEVDTPTNFAKRKSRQQKETELTLALVGPLETPEEREARERKESTKIFEDIMKEVEDLPEKRTRFTEIMMRAATEGTVQTYKDLSELVGPQSHIQELLLDLLSESQAASVSKEVYQLHQQRINMKKFILKLNVAYRHQPAYHARVLRELDTMCADSSLTVEALRALALKLFKHNQHLLDHFMLLVPGVEPPDTMLPSPEHLDFPESDSDNSCVASDTETITVQKSPDTYK